MVLSVTGFGVRRAMIAILTAFSEGSGLGVGELRFRGPGATDTPSLTLLRRFESNS